MICILFYYLIEEYCCALFNLSFAEVSQQGKEGSRKHILEDEI